MTALTRLAVAVPNQCKTQTPALHRRQSIRYVQTIRIPERQDITVRAKTSTVSFDD